MNGIEKYTKNKLKSSYPDFILDNVALLSINKNKSSLVGSYSFAYPQFPSDIDVREVVDEGYSYEEVVQFFANSIRQKVNEIMSKAYHWVLEVKIGFNPLYEDEEVPLRWSVSSINDGYKVIEGGWHVDIHDAIRQKSVINMEVIGVSNNKFMDMSNFFALVYYDKNGDPHSVNLPDASVTDFPSFYISEIKDSISSLYNQEEPDYAKMVKRYFSLGRFTKDESLIEKIAPFINSEYSLAGQKKSELALLAKAVDHIGLERLPTNIFINQLQNIKLSLSSVVSLDSDTLDIMNGVIDTVSSLRYPDDTVILLTNIKNVLMKFVNNAAEIYLAEVGLNPPPEEYIN